MSSIPPLFSHQQETISLLRSSPRVFDMSDPGTGKTRAAIEAFAERRRNGGGKALVLAPKSILQAAWGNDIDRFAPGISYMCCYARNREQAFKLDVDAYITNHDAVSGLDKLLPASYWRDFDTLIIDESTAFKHNGSQRSKAARKLATRFQYRELMTGTPNPNSVTELWHQAFLLDDGERLGKSFYKFRNMVCEPTQVGPAANHLKWADKEGIEQAVYALIQDISIRHKFEDCVDIPPNHTYSVYVDLPPKTRKLYNTLLEQTVLELDSGAITPISASAVATKLAQIAAGAVYVNDAAEVIDDTRTEVIMDLVDARQSVVVPFIWKHQRDMLTKAAEERGFAFSSIDGDASDRERASAVAAFQAGDLRVLFIHPQSAGHGLTLTRGTATIFASPTYNAEHYKQVFHRIYRTGQTQRTETIHIIARDTIDEVIYDRLDGKLTAMQLLLALAEANQRQEAA